MLTKKQLNKLGGFYGSLEALYLDQCLGILDRTTDTRDELQLKYNKLLKKHEVLKNKLKKTYNEGYNQGYHIGLEEGWKDEFEKSLRD